VRHFQSLNGGADQLIRADHFHTVFLDLLQLTGLPDKRIGRR